MALTTTRPRRHGKSGGEVGRPLQPGAVLACLLLTIRGVFRRRAETVFDLAVGAGADVVRREIRRAEALCFSPRDQCGREDSEDGAIAARV